MATIQEYREQIDHKLAYLEMEASALEEELNLTHEQIIQKYEQLKISLRAALANVKQKLNNYKQLTEDQRQQIMKKIDEIQIDLEIGKIDTEHKIREQKQKLMGHIKRLEQAIDQYLKEKSADFAQLMLQATDKLAAELETMEVSFYLQNQKKVTDNLRRKKEEIVNQLNDFKHNLAEKRELTALKSERFEKELTQKLKSIKSAFQHIND